MRIVSRLRKKTVGEKTKLRRAVCVVTSVVVVFSICFLPCAIARAVLLGVRLKNLQAVENIVVQVYDSLMVLSYIDCLLDPLVYCFCNSGFKDAYISTFCPLVLQKRLINTDFGLGTTTTTSGTRTISLPIIDKWFFFFSYIVIKTICALPLLIYHTNSITTGAPTQVFSATYSLKMLGRAILTNAIYSKLENTPDAMFGCRCSSLWTHKCICPVHKLYVVVFLYKS